MEERERNAVEKGVLYVVATPIGNMGDITERALKVLSGVDFIAAEDTRKTGLLLSRLGISAPLTSYYEHNKYEKGPKIVERIKNGESCAVVTDAGTPAVSDPGSDLVKLCSEHGIRTVPIPGACAAIAALVVSTLPTERFVFEGFLPTDGKNRKKRLEEIGNERRTVVIYEAPHRLRTTLKDISSIASGRRLTLCRELTKLNEEIIKTTADDAAKLFEEKEPRGEFVLVLQGRTGEEKADYPDDVREHVDSLIKAGLGRMDAIKRAAKERGVPKNVIYTEYSGKDGE